MEGREVGEGWVLMRLLCGRGGTMGARGMGSGNSLFCPDPCLHPRLSGMLVVGSYLQIGVSAGQLHAAEPSHTLTLSTLPETALGSRAGLWV